jgi:aldose 1-epimerase
MNVTRSIPLSVTVYPYEHEGSDKLFRVILRNENMTVELTNIGCAITAIHTPDNRNKQANIVAGFSDLVVL